MQRLLIVCLSLLVTLPWPNCGLAQSDQEYSHPDLRKELLERMERDQVMRKKLIEMRADKDEAILNADPKVIGELMKVDKENREWLAERIDELGWPGKSKVGVDGAHAAWLLVQHSDQDREFQKRCLTLMQEAGIEEVSGVDIAYLTDRVLVGEGKPQRYGTQVNMVDGKPVVGECEDPDNLDARRAELGMDSIEKYLDMVRKAYGLDK